MNMSISDIGYFSVPCFEDLAQKLEEIFVANYFCKGKSSIEKKAEKIKSFAKAFLINFEDWVMDFRFCDEDFDFIIRFPWCSYDVASKCVILSQKIVILRTPDSDEMICGKIIKKFTKIFWNEYFILPVRDFNIGPIPDKVLYFEKENGEKLIPDWPKQQAAFFYSINHGGDPVSCWFAGEKELLNQGYVFASCLPA